MNIERLNNKRKPRETTERAGKLICTTAALAAAAVLTQIQLSAQPLIPSQAPVMPSTPVGPEIIPGQYLVTLIPELWLEDSRFGTQADKRLKVPMPGQRLEVDRGFVAPPLAFERNEGQFDADVAFLARGSGCHFFLAHSEAVIVLFEPQSPATSLLLPKVASHRTPAEDWKPEGERPAGANPTRRNALTAARVLRMQLVRANATPSARGENELRGKVNYFLGNDPARWHTNIATFGRVRYEQVYPGIDLVYYGNNQRMEYDFVVAPGADPSIISLAFEGADKVEVDAQGGLLLSVGEMHLRWCQPKVYQQLDGRRQEIAGNYVLNSRSTAHGARLAPQVAFHLANYDASQPLVIDPVLVYSTYLGGGVPATPGNGAPDYGRAIAADRSGNAYVTGETRSADFPTRNPVQRTFAGGLYGDAFVAKFGPDGALVYSTYLGGSGDEDANVDDGAIATDDAGSAYVTGGTSSTDFPVINAFQPQYGYSGSSLSGSAFVTKVSPDGASLIYSTYLGGSGGSDGSAIAVDHMGRAYVTGGAGTNFPIYNALYPANGSGGNGFLAKLQPAGNALVYSTFLPSAGGAGVAADSAGNAYVCGGTSGPDFPIRNPIQPTLKGREDGFIAKINSDGSSLLFSTFYGGTGNDVAQHIALGPDGDIYTSFYTVSSDFPTVNPFQAQYRGHGDSQTPNVAIVRMKSDGSSVVFSTYLGGSGGDWSSGLGVDGAGNAYVGGQTFSADFPLADPLPGTGFSGPGGEILSPGAGFITALKSDGSALLFSSYFGYTNLSSYQNVAPLGFTLDAAGSIYLSGYTSGGIPITNAFQPSVAGGLDAFVTKLSPVVPPVMPVAITGQPTNLALIQGQPAVFTVVATGTPPLSYQWRKQGQPISGATNSVFSIPSVLPTDAGLYSVLVTNVAGPLASDNATLSVLPTVPLAFALNTSNLVWTTDSLNFWYGQTGLSHDGVAAARSMAIANGEQSALRTTIAGPATLSFWWKVSSQTNADVLSFLSIGGATTNLSAQISGETGWQQVSLLLPDGPQTMVWTYAKDASQSDGLDAGFVDQVSYVYGATLPYIISNPVSQTTSANIPVTFSVQANGTPVLAFQWRHNGVDIPGATSNDFTLPAPTSADAGAYSVRVYSPYGATNSTSASLTFIPLVLSGDNSQGQSTLPSDATNLVAIAAGQWHSLGLRVNGSVLAWGDNGASQCDVPPGLTNILAIAAGGYHSMAIQADGTIVAWGANDSGQIDVPAGLRQVIGIAAGTWHSLALRRDGTVKAWGDNTWGQSSVPVGLSNVVAIAAAGSHSLALDSNGTVVAWGENTSADGHIVGQSVVPLGLTGVMAIAAGEYHSLAVRSDGTVAAWGDNSQGQTSVPSGLGDVVAVAGGGQHSLALRANGTVAAWGDNWNGQCNLPSSLASVAGLAGGEEHSLLLITGSLPIPKLLNPVRTPTAFSFLIQTLNRKHYALEFKNSLSATSWTAISSSAGNGALELLTDYTATGNQRFYRLREW